MVRCEGGGRGECTYLCESAASAARRSRPAC